GKAGRRAALDCGGAVPGVRLPGTERPRPGRGRRTRPAAALRRHALTAVPRERGAWAAYLSMSPTTKNRDPRTAARSPTRCPGSRAGSTAMLLNEADLSWSRHGVFPPRETR